MKDAITIGLAVYGAVLTTVLAYSRHRANKPKVRLAFAIETVRKRSEVVVYAVNTGSRKLAIAEVGVRGFREIQVHAAAAASAFGGEMQVIPMTKPLFEVELPARLEDSDQLEIRYDVSDVQAAIEFSEGEPIIYRLTDTHRRHYDFPMPKHIIAQVKMFSTIKNEPNAEFGAGFVSVTDSGTKG